MTGYKPRHGMKRFRLLVLPLLLLMLAACSQPLPHDKAHYAGHWQGEGMSLLITRDGRVSYKRYDGGMTKSIDAPLKAFQGDDFEVGVAFMTTLFDVQKPPVKENSVWTMTVDGVVLTRKANR